MRASRITGHETTASDAEILRHRGSHDGTQSETLWQFEVDDNEIMAITLCVGKRTCALPPKLCCLNCLTYAA